MHLYIITRGIKHEVDKFITQLQGKYLPFPITKKGVFGAKKAGIHQLQLAVRPIQLWEIVYPEPCRDAILTTILGKDDAYQGKTQHRKHNKWIYAIRKALGVKKIGEYKTDNLYPITPEKQHIEVVGIGEKKDYYKGENEGI